MKTISHFCKDAAFSSLPYFDGICFCSMPTPDGTFQMGVNWSCMGTRDADDVAAFAADLARAAEIARTFPANGRKVVYR